MPAIRRGARASARSAAVALLCSLLAIMAGCACPDQAGEGDSEEVLAQRVTVDLYFIRSDADQEYLEKEPREIDAGGDTARSAMEELIRGPASGSGLMPVLPASTRVLSCETAMGICVVDLSREAILHGSEIGSTATREKLVLGAIADTLTAEGRIGLVVLRIEGAQSGELGGFRIENFWGHVRLPSYMERDEGIVGRKTSSAPAWQGIDRMAVARAWGWREISRGRSLEKRMAITIDGGSGGDLAHQFLDVLKDFDEQCTFFLTGQFIRENPAVVLRMVEEGHEIGNHSQTHPHFNQLDQGQLVDQIKRAEEALAGLSGYPMQPYFRFPYGERGPGQVDMLRELGYMSVMWTVDSMGWDEGTSPETAYTRVMRAASPGAVALLHFDSSPDLQMLPSLIRDLRGAGYELVTMTELLYPGP